LGILGGSGKAAAHRQASLQPLLAYHRQTRPAGERRPQALQRLQRLEKVEIRKKSLGVNKTRPAHVIGVMIC
jgi:hypothetical protein